jgi:hypothetical protein
LKTVENLSRIWRNNPPFRKIILAFRHFSTIFDYFRLMDQIDIPELNRIYFEAIRQGEQKKLADEKAKQKKLEAENKENEIWVAAQLQQLAGKLTLAASRGEKKVKVWKVEDMTSYKLKNYAALECWDTRTQMGRRYSLLCEKIAKTGLTCKPTYEHDGVGMSSWITIYASF